MYTSFYQLDNKPFDLNPDPAFFWPGEKFEEALATLRHALSENKGFLLLTGAAGSGKTTLIKSLTHSLADEVNWAVIEDPLLERIDFYNAISRGFGIDKLFSSKVQFLIQFSHFLHTSDDERKRALLLVDDCHLLSQEMLEELRLLSNIERADTKLLNIFFVGQPHFDELLHQPKNRAVSQRLTLVADLPPLNVNETDEYIRHRLSVAGTEERLFAAGAVQAIHRISRGIPRQINIICDQALAIGASQGLNVIDNKVVESIVQGMDQPARPFQDVLQPLSSEQNDPSTESGTFVPKPAGAIPSSSGFNLEKQYRFGWLKYLAALLVLCTAGSYFWYSSTNSLESDGQVAGEAAEAPVVKVIGMASSSPAVTMLEENKSGLDKQKAAELKTAILARAYDLDKDQPKKILEVAAAEPEPAGQGKAETAVLPPLEPAKVVLGLHPNSLKLTREAQRQLNSFVDKLKLYPRATVFVKGYVSAKKNSPENIQLSLDRALAVQKLMLAKGIDVEQIEVVGMGNQEPIASNDTWAGRMKNRRVEICIISDGTK